MLPNEACFQAACQSIFIIPFPDYDHQSISSAPELKLSFMSMKDYAL